MTNEEKIENGHYSFKFSVSKQLHCPVNTVFASNSNFLIRQKTSTSTKENVRIRTHRDLELNDDQVTSPAFLPEGLLPPLSDQILQTLSCSIVSKCCLIWSDPLQLAMQSFYSFRYFSLKARIVSDVKLFISSFPFLFFWLQLLSLIDVFQFVFLIL